MPNPWLEQLRGYAFTFEGTWEDFPWGHESPVFKNGSAKIFAMTGIDESTGNLNATVKLAPDEASAALMLPFVTKAAYVGRYGWVTVQVQEQAQFDILIDWVARSHALVRKPAKKPRTPKL